MEGYGNKLAVANLSRVVMMDTHMTAELNCKGKTGKNGKG
jgi:hypothetical protein